MKHLKGFNIVNEYAHITPSKNDMMKKYVLVWHQTDGFTYDCEIVQPFECADVETFILESIEKIQNSNGVEILGIRMTNDDIDNLEHSIFTLDEWFEKKKYS